MRKLAAGPQLEIPVSPICPKAAPGLRCPVCNGGIREGVPSRGTGPARRRLCAELSLYGTSIDPNF